MLLVGLLVVALIQVSSQYIDYFWLNTFVLGMFTWIFASFIWEFGYTIHHVKRYSVWLLLLMLIPLPLYMSVYASNLDVNSSEVTRR